MMSYNVPAVAKWVSDQIGCPMTQGMSVIGYVTEDRIVAGVIYNYYTGKAVDAAIAVARGAWLPKQFWHQIFDYPFNQLGVDKIVIYVNSSNKPSLKLATKLGFTFVSVIPDIYEDGDLVIGTLVKEECTWLRSSHGTEVEAA